MAHPDYVAWQKHVENQKAKNERPEPMSFQKAQDEACKLVRDFRDEPDASVVTIFEYEGGYQIDAITNHPEFEIYRHLYEGKDVKAIAFIEGREIKFKLMK